MTHDRSSVRGPLDRAAGRFATAALAHERPESTAAGMAMLPAGNAVDAAVAAAFAACVVMPAATTIAGSGFMLVDPGTGQAPVAIEFPSRAPSRASADMYELAAAQDATGMLGVSAVMGNANAWGARSVGVPAVVAGLCEAHARFGRLPLAHVLAPAIALAHEGFAIHAELQMQTVQVLRELRAAGAAVRGSLLAHDGLPLPLFDGADRPTLVMQPDLAVTLEAIARDGADGFYRGAPGARIVDEVQRRGGILALDDLARVEPLVTTPMSLRIGNATAWAPTSPGGGWTELQILGVLSRLGLLGADDPFDVPAYLEASRRCFADRFHFMGDPEHVDVPLDVLLSDDYLDALAGEVANGRLTYPEAPPWGHYASCVPEAFARHRPDLVPTPWEARTVHGAAGLGDSFETTHVSTMDRDGMAVSCTLTAAEPYGSKVVGAGVVLDDAMIWFNAAAGAANSIAPWKRPLANMGPLLVCHDDGRTLAVGAPGGRRIMSAVTQVVAHWLRGDSLEQATARPRVDGSGSQVLASVRLESDRVQALRDAGYVVQPVDDRDPLCFAFARPVAVASTDDGAREAAVQPFVSGWVAGR